MTSRSHRNTRRARGKDVVQVFSEHRGDVIALEYSFDGKVLAIASDDKTIRLWDAYTGKLMRTLLFNEFAIVAFSFSPDGRHLGVLAPKIDSETTPPTSLIQVYDFHTGVVVTSVEHSEEPVLGRIQYSPDGRLLAFFTRTKLLLFNPLSGEMHPSSSTPYEGSQNQAVLRFSGDGKRVFFVFRSMATGLQLALRSLNVETGQTENHHSSLSRFQSNTPMVVLSPDCKLVAGIMPSQGFQVCNVETGKLLHGPQLGPHCEDMTCLSFSPDGKRLVAGSVDGTISAWDAVTGDLVSPPWAHWPAPHSPIKVVAYSMETGRVVSVNRLGKIRLWDTRTGDIILTSEERPLSLVCGPVYSLAWFSSGSSIFSGRSCDSHVRLWNTTTGQSTTNIVCRGDCRIALSPDESRLAVGSINSLGQVVLFDVKSGRELSSLMRLSGHGVHEIEYSPDGRLLAVLLYNGELYIFDPDSGERRQDIDAGISGSRINDISFSSDNRHFAYLTGSLCIYDLQDKQIVVTLAEDEALCPIVFSPDGVRILGNTTSGLTVWDISTGAELMTRPGHLERAAWSPDGRRMLIDRHQNGTKVGTMEILDATSGDTLWKAASEEESMTALAFSPDGMRFATGSERGEIKTWDAGTCKELVVFGSKTDDAEASVESLARRDSEIELDDFQITSRAAAPAKVSSAPPVSSVGTRRNPHSKSTTSRVGLMARIASSLQSYLSAPHDDASQPAEDQTQKSQRGRRPLGRAFALVSVGRAKDRVFARGGGNKRRNSRQEPEDDDDRDIPSPDPEDAARTSPSDQPSGSGEAATDDDDSSISSKHGCVDTICYCLCIPCCRL